MTRLVRRQWLLLAALVTSVLASPVAALATHFYSTRAEKALESLINTDGSCCNLTFADPAAFTNVTVSTLTASQLVGTNGSKALVTIAGTSSSTVLVGGTPPAFTATPSGLTSVGAGTMTASTSVTSPIIYGGTADTATLTLTPSSHGTPTTGADLILNVGGGTVTPPKVRYNGRMQIGEVVTPENQLHVVRSLPSSDFATSQAAIYGLMSINASAAVTATALPGARGDVTVSGANRITEAVGLWGQIGPWTNTHVNSAASAIIAHFRMSDATARATRMTGLRTSLDVDQGVADDVIGLYVNQVDVTGTGAVTNVYGLKVLDLTGAGKTNVWGVWSGGATQKNHFAGPVGLGSVTAPTSALHIGSSGTAPQVYQFGTVIGSVEARVENLSSSGSARTVLALWGNDGSGAKAHSVLQYNNNNNTTELFTSQSTDPLSLGVNSTAVITIATTRAVTLAGAANTVPLTISGYSVTGSGTSALLAASGTLNTSGVTHVNDWSITNTASGAGSTLFRIRAGSGGTTAAFSITTTGSTITADKLRSNTTAPTVGNVGANSCGTTAATITGTDVAGKVTVGATSGTQCRITFSSAWPTAPACTVTNETTANLLRATSTTTTVDLAGTMVGGDVLAYMCIGGS